MHAGGQHWKALVAAAAGGGSGQHLLVALHHLAAGLAPWRLALILAATAAVLRAGRGVL